MKDRRYCMNTKHYDLIVLGFGKAGKTLAAKLGSMGKAVAMIEENPLMYGGTCINMHVSQLKR